MVQLRSNARCYPRTWVRSSIGLALVRILFGSCRTTALGDLALNTASAVRRGGVRYDASGSESTGAKGWRTGVLALSSLIPKPVDFRGRTGGPAGGMFSLPGLRGVIGGAGAGRVAFGMLFL